MACKHGIPDKPGCLMSVEFCSKCGDWRNIKLLIDPISKNNKNQCIICKIFSFIGI